MQEVITAARFERLAAPLVRHLQELKDKRDRARGEGVRLAGQLEAARGRVEELQLALDQLELLLAPAAVEVAA
jgi:hypothetical protein